MKGWLVAAVLVLFATSAQPQVTSVGFWNFDEGSGLQATDSSGEANHGNVSGATWIDGAQGPHALRFGGNDGVYMGDPSTLEPTTLSVGMCVRSSTPQPYKLLLSEGLHGCTCASYALILGHNEEVYFYTCDNTQAFFTATIPGADVWDGRWHRIVATWDGGFVRIYFDGMPFGAPVAGVPPNYSLSTHSDFQIGNIAACGVSGFQGDIDEVGVWDGVLSDSEIEALGDCNELMEDGFESGDTSAWSETVN
jgi:hypothetical protein